MKDGTTVIGLDVHKDTVVAATLPWGLDEAREVITISNRPEPVMKWLGRYRGMAQVVFVYEAGPCGYGLQRLLNQQGHRCAVIAPTLTPIRPGDRIKTDPRDAQKLAKLYRSGELTEIRIPTTSEEAARDLLRVREDILEDRLRARHRLSKFLLRQGRLYVKGQAWSIAHRMWLRAQAFEPGVLQQSFDAYVRAAEEAENRLLTINQQVQDLATTAIYRLPVQYLRCLKGIETLSALTLITEAQDFRRYPNAPAFMGATGLVPCEHSSGGSRWRGAITKTGNAHIRRVLVEAAWNYRLRNTISKALSDRRRGCPTPVIAIAQKAQDRLHRLFWRMTQSCGATGHPAGNPRISV